MKIKINMIGLHKQEVKSVLSKYFNMGIQFNIVENYYETDVEIACDDSQEKLFDEIVREVYVNFSKSIYGSNEKNIYSAAFELLKYKGYKLAIAESVTAGRLSSEFVAQNEGASKILIEGIVCYSVESKKRRLGVSDETIEKYSPQSVECSYELASGLISTTSADVVIATTGYASNDPNDENNGKCFIAVGDKNIIHVFKHSFKGNRNHIMQRISKTAFLHLIKKIKQNDFDLPQNVI